jgi:hypothetical protein
MRGSTVRSIDESSASNQRVVLDHLERLVHDRARGNSLGRTDASARWEVAKTMPRSSLFETPRAITIKPEGGE